MSHDHQIGNQVVLRLAGVIAGTTITGKAITRRQIRLETGDEISLTPEQLAGATSAGEALALLFSHVRTGEPLDAEEVAVIAASGLAESSDFDGVGGGLHAHVSLRSGSDDDV